jgi:hypothetical protein
VYQVPVAEDGNELVLGVEDRQIDSWGFAGSCSGPWHLVEFGRIAGLGVARFQLLRSEYCVDTHVDRLIASTSRYHYPQIISICRLHSPLRNNVSPLSLSLLP